MLSKKLIEILKKQHYGLVGNHTGVQICRWTKNSLRGEGVCYKEKFYGIKSHRCCQMSPVIGFCQNKCLHCWRAVELTIGEDMNKINKNKLDIPSQIIDECIEQQRKLLNGFKGNKKINLKKFREAQEPMQFAISLTGEPTLYPKIGELISELRKRGKTSFLVTNGLQPEILKKLNKNKQLPTQLYVSLNSPNKKLYEKWHRSSVKNAWKKFNETLELFPKLSMRKVIRMTLVRDLNMTNPFKKGLTQNKDYVEEYVKLIKKAKPDFIEVKGYKSVGFARKRLGYDMMPKHKEIKDYSKKIVVSLRKQGYKILDEHEKSAVVLIGKDKGRMRVKKGEV